MNRMEQPQSIENLEKKPKARKILRKKKLEEFWGNEDPRLVHVDYVR